MLTMSGSFSGFSVDDLTAAASFYRDKLGLTVTETEIGLSVALPGGRLFERYEGMPQDGKGVMRASEGWGPDIAWFTDPAGNILSVTTPA